MLPIFRANMLKTVYTLNTCFLKLFEFFNEQYVSFALFYQFVNVAKRLHQNFLVTIEKFNCFFAGTDRD